MLETLSKPIIVKLKKLGFRGNELKYLKDLITFIYGTKSTKGIKLFVSSVSKLRNRKMIWKPVPPKIENIEFVEYIIFNYPLLQSLFIP